MIMSSMPSPAFEPTQPDWLWDLLGVDGPWDGERELLGDRYRIERGIPRSGAVLSERQAQTEEAFGFKWKKRDTFDSQASLAGMKRWLVERYGDVGQAKWLGEHGERPLVVDAGCGAGMSGAELWAEVLPRARYLGVDVSEAIDVAAARFHERGHVAAFIQASLSRLPLPERSVDLIFSEGVLHHTDSTRGALLSLARHLKVGGRFLFYVYKTKGPIREFTDDYIRAKLQPMAPQAAWDAMEPLTDLGIMLGELGITVDVPRAIDVLGIPAGKIDIQRLFYWHVAKMYYRPDLSFDEMNHINYDWYAPANAARQSPEEVRAWCAEAGLEIEREIVEDAGITVIARMTG